MGINGVCDSGLSYFCVPYSILNGWTFIKVGSFFFWYNETKNVVWMGKKMEENKFVHKDPI